MKLYISKININILLEIVHHIIPNFGLKYLHEKSTTLFNKHLIHCMNKSFINNLPLIMDLEIPFLLRINFFTKYIMISVHVCAYVGYFTFSRYNLFNLFNLFIYNLFNSIARVHMLSISRRTKLNVGKITRRNCVNLVLIISFEMNRGDLWTVMASYVIQLIIFYGNVKSTLMKRIISWLFIEKGVKVEKLL